MTTRLIHRTNRLSKLLTRPGGIAARDAIGRAEANVVSVRESTIAEVDRRIDGLKSAVLRSADDESARREIYSHANVIAGIAASGGMEHLGHAAYHLCELVDRYEVSGGWNDRAIIVCLDALAVLRAPTDDQPINAAEHVLAGLAEMVRRVGRPASA